MRNVVVWMKQAEQALLSRSQLVYTALHTYIVKRVVLHAGCRPDSKHSEIHITG